jgi:hypothetical protein
MKQNVGNTERIIRVVAGLIVLSMLFFVEGNLRYLGFIGLIPLITGILGYCPLYTIFKVNTNKTK